MLLALIYALRILQEQKFSQLSDRLGAADNHRMADIVNITYIFFINCIFNSDFNSGQLWSFFATSIFRGA